MGLIIGLIGANIIAKNIGEKAKEYAQIKADAEIEKAKINAYSNRDVAEIYSDTILGTEKMRFLRDIATTSMRTGMFGALSEDRDKYAKSERGKIEPKKGNKKRYFCSECGEQQDYDAVFCKYCGSRI